MSRFAGAGSAITRFLSGQPRRTTGARTGGRAVARPRATTTARRAPIIGATSRRGFGTVLPRQTGGGGRLTGPGAPRLVVDPPPTTGGGGLTAPSTGGGRIIRASAGGGGSITRRRTSGFQGSGLSKRAFEQRQAATRVPLQRAQTQEQELFAERRAEALSAREQARGLFGQAREEVAGLGGVQREEIERQRQRDLARMTQQLRARGLGGTTLLENLQRGVSEDESRRLRAVGEQQARLRAGLLTQQATGAELPFAGIVSNVLANAPVLQAQPTAGIFQALLNRIGSTGVLGFGG